MSVNVAHLSLEIPGNLFLDAGSSSQLTFLSLPKFSLYKGLATFLSLPFQDFLWISSSFPLGTFSNLPLTHLFFYLIPNNFQFITFSCSADKKGSSTHLNQSIAPFLVPTCQSSCSNNPSLSLVQKTVKLLTNFILLTHNQKYPRYIPVIVTI